MIKLFSARELVKVDITEEQTTQQMRDIVNYLDTYYYTEYELIAITEYFGVINITCGGTYSAFIGSDFKKEIDNFCKLAVIPRKSTIDIILHKMNKTLLKFDFESHSFHFFTNDLFQTVTLLIIDFKNRKTKEYVYDKYDINRLEQNLKNWGVPYKK